MSETIPHILHYVWMGGKPKPFILRRCIKSWHKKMPDWKVIEWNENNFPISEHPFAQKAYQNKQWAFVSDYVRMWALYTHGGIYLDTDVMVVRDLTPLCRHRAFVGFENQTYPFTSVFGATAKHPFIRDVIKAYDKKNNHSYNFSDNNTIFVSDILIKQYHCKPNNQPQVLRSDIKVYPDNILCNPSPESYAIHLFYGGWENSGRNFKNKTREVLRGYILTTPRRLELYYKLRGKVDE